MEAHPVCSTSSDQVAFSEFLEHRKSFSDVFLYQLFAVLFHYHLQLLCKAFQWLFLVRHLDLHLYFSTHLTITKNEVFILYTV